MQCYTSYNARVDEYSNGKVKKAMTGEVAEAEDIDMAEVVVKVEPVDEDEAVIPVDVAVKDEVIPDIDPSAALELVNIDSMDLN